MVDNFKPTKSSATLYGFNPMSIDNVSQDTTLGKFSPYDIKLWQKFWKYSERELYADYRKEKNSNPFAFFVSEFLLREILADGFHFEGDGDDEVQEFFDADDTEEKLEVVIRNTIDYGNGFLDLKTKNSGKILVSTNYIYGESVKIERKNGIKTFTQDKAFIDSFKDLPLNSKNTVHFYFKDFGYSPYGFSFFRPNLFFLKALNDVGGDIPAALKRVAYAPILAKLDLQGYKTQAEKKAAIKEFGDKLHQVISATTNYVIDSKHEMGLLGAGGAGARLLPVIDLIEPLISIVWLNYDIPLGYYLQSTSNRAIIDTQANIAARGVKFFRKKVANTINKRIIPLITKKDCKMVFNKSFPEYQAEAEFWLNLYDRRVISKELLLDKLDIVDTGEEFADYEFRARGIKNDRTKEILDAINDLRGKHER